MVMVQKKPAEVVNTYLLATGETTVNTYLENKYRCKYCGSATVTYYQYVDDAYCAGCGAWQNDFLNEEERSK